MSKFAQLVIPFLADGLTNIDLTGATGFIDAYTIDPDHPSGEKEFYLMYDMTVHNKFSEECACKLAKNKWVKKSYIKYINGKPCMIYSFWVYPAIKDLFDTSGIILSSARKATILQFWGGFSALARYINDNNSLWCNKNLEMPLDDYRKEHYELSQGLYITKKTGTSNEMSAFFLFPKIERFSDRKNYFYFL